MITRQDQANLFNLANRRAEAANKIRLAAAREMWSNKEYWENIHFQAHNDLCDLAKVAYFTPKEA